MRSEVRPVSWIAEERRVRRLLDAVPQSEMPVRVDPITTDAAELAAVVELQFEVVIELWSEAVSCIRAECDYK